MAKFRNQKLAQTLANTPAQPNLVAAKKIPTPNTVNRQGFEAYSIDKWLRLLALLNVTKLQNEFYRTESQAINEVKLLVGECATENPYLTAQCIVYSRCMGEGMRSVNHLAATELAKYVSGQEWAKRFYGLWNKKAQKGGTIYRPDDISEIVACYSALNPKTVTIETRNGQTQMMKNVAITNAMKKGFKSALENMDAHLLLKYKNSLLDIINLVRPNPKASKATVTYNGEIVPVFDAIIKGYNVSADTWEVAQSDAGQEVAKAVKEGKITKTEATEILAEAKSDNWKGLLTDGKLGILAAIRNIRNILLNKPDSTTIDLLCQLIGDPKNIIQGKIMPYQIDLAIEVINTEFSDPSSRRVVQTLLKVYEDSIPNLSQLLIGNNLVIVDLSGSMSTRITDGNAKNRKSYKSTCADKALLIAATIAKATNADIIRFGSSAEYVKYNANQDVFSLGGSMYDSMGGTNLDSAWRCAANSGRVYNRVFILSDNECNVGSSYNGYTNYISKCGDPYVYSIDLAAYGTTAIAGPKVRYYYGYGFSMFEDIATSEFNPMAHIDKVKKIVI